MVKKEKFKGKEYRLEINETNIKVTTPTEITSFRKDIDVMKEMANLFFGAVFDIMEEGLPKYVKKRTKSWWIYTQEGDVEFKDKKRKLFYKYNFHTRKGRKIK